MFWTDSQVVLAYIRSTTRRFKVFVANQAQKIQEDSDVNQSNYVKGKDNPADDQCSNFSYKVAGNLFTNSEA